MRGLFVIGMGAICWACGSGAATAEPPARRAVSALDSSAAARIAVVTTSCLFDIDADRRLAEIYQSVATDDDVDRAAAACLSAHRDGCGAVAACLATTVRFAPALTRCEGDVAFTSVGDREVRTDCGRLGRGCVVSGALARCTHDALDCPRLGLVRGERTCVGAGPACTGGVSTTTQRVTFDGTGCSDDKLQACVAGGSVMLDCSALVGGAECFERDGAAYCGIGASCVPGEVASPSCEGDAVVVCNGGRIDRVSCTELGFARCVQRATPLGQRYAACE